MPRSKRCEFQGAIHLVTVCGYSGGHVFYDPQIFRLFPENPRGHAPDAHQFESLLWESCEQYNARVHAYIMEPNAAQIIIQTLGAPLTWIVHDLIARYSMFLIHQHRTQEGVRPFPRRYRAQIVQPEKLPYAVRGVERRAPTADQRHRAINHPFSSNLIYCGRRPQPGCFVVSAMREALARLGYAGLAAYFEFITAADSPSIAHMLSGQIIGDRKFIESLPERCRKPPRGPSPDEILREVTGTLLHTDADTACSSTHRGALARALVAWYAMRTGTAQIGTVARWFSVTSSDLRYLIHRHRRENPEYFSKPLSELFPALSRAGQTMDVPRASHSQRPRIHAGRSVSWNA